MKYFFKFYKSLCVCGRLKTVVHYVLFRFFRFIHIGHFQPKMRYNLKMVQDRYIVLLQLNRKSYMLYRMAMFPMTFGDP